MFTFDEHAPAHSRRLLESLRGRPPLSALATSTLEVASLAQLEPMLRDAEERLRGHAESFSAIVAVPTLIDAIGRCYYGPESQEMTLRIFGPALKIALAAVWPSIWRGTNASNSPDDLISLVAAALLVDQLQILRRAYFGFNAEGRVRIDATSIHADGSVRDALDSFQMAFAPRGEVLRLAESTTRSLQWNPAAAFQGVLRVLSGESPSLVPGLADTWMARLPLGVPLRFWEGLATRLLMWLSLIESQKGHDVDPIRPMLCGNTLAVVDIGIAPPRSIVLHTQELFWTRKWYARRSPFEYRHLIGDRPLLRVQSAPPSYCTSLVLVGDSINWFVESSVMKYPGSAGTPLPDACFREVLSKPFEEKVHRELSTLGFRAGPVTRKGAWRLQDQVVDLSSLAGAPPGEIDVLAVHDAGCIVLCECKIIAFPFTDSRLRNILRKLGKEDAEAIRAVARRKLAWLRAVADRLVNDPRAIAAYVVLDGPWPGTGAVSDVSVLDLPRMIADVGMRLSALRP
jgi:hypothetical protein